jgi:hypothetical protein
MAAVHPEPWLRALITNNNNNNNTGTEFGLTNICMLEILRKIMYYLKYDTNWLTILCFSGPDTCISVTEKRLRYIT